MTKIRKCADTINQLWNSEQKWQRWTLALCWRSPATGACLLRSFKVLEGNEAGVRLRAAFESDNVAEMSPLKLQCMLQHVLKLHPHTEEVHVFSTGTSRKLVTSNGTLSVQMTLIMCCVVC
jgi:hypothetical protein